MISFDNGKVYIKSTSWHNSMFEFASTDVEAKLKLILKSKASEVFVFISLLVEVVTAQSKEFTSSKAMVIIQIH